MGLEVKANSANHDKALSLMAVGDVMLGRHVGEQLTAHPPDWLFSQVQNVLEKSDILI